MGSLLGSHYHPKSREAEQQWMNICVWMSNARLSFFHEAPQSLSLKHMRGLKIRATFLGVPKTGVWFAGV